MGQETNILVKWIDVIVCYSSWIHVIWVFVEFSIRKNCSLWLNSRYFASVLNSIFINVLLKGLEKTSTLMLAGSIKIRTKLETVFDIRIIRISSICRIIDIRILFPEVAFNYFGLLYIMNAFSYVVSILPLCECWRNVWCNAPAAQSQYQTVFNSNLAVMKYKFFSQNIPFSFFG